mmetsp:Transcript_38546/g.43770  ORF Transcript_38546/g.43770 Transcript_38546/m.43770 type:complete len:113 (-) Transcript_38546:571-909(-)
MWDTISENITPSESCESFSQCSCSGKNELIHEKSPFSFPDCIYSRERGQKNTRLNCFCLYISFYFEVVLSPSLDCSLIILIFLKEKESGLKDFPLLLELTISYFSHVDFLFF